MDVSKILSDMVMGFFSMIFNEGINYISDLIENMYSISSYFLELSLVNETFRYVQYMSFSILGVKILTEIFNTYILYQSGDPEADPTGVLIRAAQSTAVIACAPWIIEYIYTFSTQVTSDIVNLSSGTVGNPSLAGITFSVAFSPVFLIILLIMFIVVFFQMALRGACIALMKVLIPLFALSLTGQNRNKWTAFFNQLFINIVLSSAIQIFLIKCFFASYVGIGTNNIGAMKGLMMFGWLGITISAPKFIQNIVYQSGIGHVLAGAARQGGTAIIMKAISK